MPNLCVLTGNLGADPEMRYSSEGMPIAGFNLAFKSGKEKTSWIKISAFKKLAEICEKYLHKGAKVTVIGCLEQQKWRGQNGESRSGYKLLANSIEFIKTNGKGFNGSENQNEDDDLPF